MAASGTIGRLVVAGILAGVVLAAAAPGAAGPMRLRLENLSSIALQSWLNPDNLVPDLGADVTTPGALPGYTIPVGSLPLFAPAVFGPGSFSDSEIEPFTAAGAYSLFAEGTITFIGSGVFAASFSDTQAVVTPQPRTMVLLGMGLIALAVLPVLRRAARR